MQYPSMRVSQMFFRTLRETPAEAELVSHALLLRGGFIRRLAAGVYSYMPLGWRVLSKVTQIIREEMDAAGGQELLMPTVLPAELWQETGRWAQYGELLAKLEDRQGRKFCLGPTHEEVITDLVRHEVRSYKQLPLLLYQIQTKFRDELRPRGGLIRGREFLMKDLYSFDRDRAGLDLSFEKMYDAYCRIFDRVGLRYSVVEAEGGDIGGTDTKEFMVIADAGEDSMLQCAACGFSANRERAECRPADGAPVSESAMLPVEKVSTPDMKKVKDVTEFLKTDARNLVKTLVYSGAGGVVAALVRGDREINEAKLARVVGPVAMADPAMVEQVSGAAVGFAGPVGLESVRMIADHEVKSLLNFVTGANETDTHLTNVNLNRDFTIKEFAYLRCAEDGDPCPQCSDGTLELKHCIEMGHVFKLGTRYSEAMNAVFQDEDSVVKPIIMGCYGIGVSRIVAAAAETSHDDKGIIWPAAIAPFVVQISLLDPNVGELAAIADKLYNDLQPAGMDVLYDDRDERPGVKFADADLIGIPIHVVIGKRTRERGEMELQLRADKSKRMVPAGDVVTAIQSLLTQSAA